MFSPLQVPLNKVLYLSAHHHLSWGLPPLSHLSQGGHPTSLAGRARWQESGLISPRETILGLLPLPRAPSHLVTGQATTLILGACWLS